jgi:hypothetical protein
MKPRIRSTIRSAKQSVLRLVEECRKDGPIYPKHPKAVAQVSRTGKWLLNAITTLEQTLDTPTASQPSAAS